MSYARFGWDDSDVYVFLCVSGYLECCGCKLSQHSGRFDTTAEMLAHLAEHQAAGHTVPADTLAELEDEREEIDARILEIRAADASRDSEATK